MNLEQKLKTRRVLRRFPSQEALQMVEQGRKFVPVEEDFDTAYVPQGYSLIRMTHRGDTFRTLIPQSLLFFMANPGEGDPDQALEEIADFYGDAKDFEDDMMDEAGTSVQEANWAVLAKNSYTTYLINRLVSHKIGAKDEKGEPVPDFSYEGTRQLGLGDRYIEQCVRAMAAVALGKTVNDIQAHEVSDVLKHVTFKKQETRQMTRQEFDQVTCWAGSHYELKSQYRNDPDKKYDIVMRHDRELKEGTVTVKEEKAPYLDSDISEYEDRIAERRKRLSDQEYTRHDRALIRMYANLKYIAPENPRAQLSIEPPKKEVKK
jgi:hypothetical protein